MSKQSFFNDETEDWSKDSQAFSREISEAIGPIIEKWAAKGFKLREMIYIAKSEVEMSGTHELVKRRIERAKSKQRPTIVRKEQ